jgi:uncharacterized protein (DUF2236 family)
MVLAGPAVLLLNLAHPLVAAGVSEHSHWQHNPAARMRATAEFMERVYFGDLHDVRTAVEGLWHMHGRVRGAAPDGRPYSARDPDLLSWVWESTVWIMARARPLLLGDPEMDSARWQEALALGAASGVPRSMLGESFEQLGRRVEARLENEVEVSAQARSLQVALRATEESVIDAHLSGPLRTAVRWSAAAFERFVDLLTASLLPEQVRAGYGLTLPAGAQIRLRAEAEAVRQARRLFPAELRYSDAQRRALARTSDRVGLSPTEGGAKR